MPTRARGPRSAAAAAMILVVCAAVGTLVGVGIRHFRSGSGDGARSHSIHVRPAAAGPQPAAGLWLFGLRTVRIDPSDLENAREVPLQAFGAVLGGNGVVYLYDPVSGRVGVVDATQNRIAGETTVSRVGDAPAAGVAPLLAAQPGVLWLVTGPGRVTRFELATGHTTDVTLPNDVVPASDVGGPPIAGATRVVADPTGAWAVYDLGVTGGGSRLAVAKLDPAGNVVSRAELPVSVGGERVGAQAVVVDNAAVWVVGRSTVVGVDRASSAKQQRFVVDRARPPVLNGAVSAGGSIWSYDGASGALLRISEQDGHVQPRVALLGQPVAGVADPAALVAGNGAVWAMLRASRASFAQQVARVDVATSSVTRQFDVPAALEVGALALSR